MLVWLGVAIVLAVVVGVPVLPVLIVASICTALLAYWNTHRQSLLIGAAALIVLGVLPLFARSLNGTVLSWLTGVVAVVFMLYCAVYGIYGPQHGDNRRVP